MAFRTSSERGTIAPLLAVSITGLVVASLFGANAASLYAVRRETQKAAQLSALAGAAAIPLVGVLASGEPGATACSQAELLLTRAAAPFSERLAVSHAGPTCLAGVTVEPLADWSTVDTARTALSQLVGSLGLTRPDLCSPLVAPLIDPWFASTSATDCAAIAQGVAGLPDNLSSAAWSPRVRVGVIDEVEAPVPLPAFSGRRTVRAHATARRRFKNVVVVPAVRTDVSGLPQPLADAISGAPMPLDSLDLNQTAATVRDQLLPRLWEANTRLSDATDPFMPAGVDLDLTQLLLDVQDLYDPPRGASPPNPADLAMEAVRTGEPLVVLRLFRMPVLGIPALDFTAATLEPLADGTFRATPVPIAQLTQAQGLFSASLVR